ncbi:hypothetical protein MTO96_024439 [Rhipicephalus appendiculatus]
MRGTSSSRTNACGAKYEECSRIGTQQNTQLAFSIVLAAPSLPEFGGHSPAKGLSTPARGRAASGSHREAEHSALAPSTNEERRGATTLRTLARAAVSRFIGCAPSSWL